MRWKTRIDFSTNESRRFGNKILTHTQKDNRYIKSVGYYRELDDGGSWLFTIHSQLSTPNDGMSRTFEEPITKVFLFPPLHEEHEKGKLLLFERSSLRVTEDSL
jgi:hypothetical protein